MICPKNQNFKVKLAPFQYEGDLQLEVIPFDLLGDQKEQISNIHFYNKISNYNS